MLNEHCYNLALEKEGYKEKSVMNKRNQNKIDTYKNVTSSDRNYNAQNKD